MTMPTVDAAGLAAADDAALRTALADAHLPSLLPALAQLTGDLSLLRAELVPDPAKLIFPQSGLTAAQQQMARDLAFGAITAYRAAGQPPAPPFATDDVRRAMDFLTGAPTSDDYLPLLLEELAFPKDDARAPGWHKDEIAPDRPFAVAVIGAGMSGILAGIRLKQAGVPFVILEKNTEVGGTWFENTYPGCRVDSSNHLYSYSFAQKSDWSHHFSTRDALLGYFKQCAADFGVRDAVRFETEVVDATWDDERNTWRLLIRTAAGAEETLEVNALISAVGQLNRPKMPNIPGMSSFAGPSFHSAEWDWSVDLRGKRVAVIGTGASATQFIPHVADDAGELRIFQRTPNWLAAVPQYHEEVPAGLQWLFANIPHYAQWYRFWLFWTSVDGRLPMATVDPEWFPRDRSVSASNDELRSLMTHYIESRLKDRPDLAAKAVPQYPPASKRIVLDNGIWPDTLKREHVQLITTGIQEITPAGLVTVDGEEHPADVIIYGTGFTASRFLTPMRVSGRGGDDLHARWDGDARAYLGITIPRFPNFFCLYGPNTNIVVNGSIIYFSECEVRYVLESLRMLLEGGHGAMDCREDVHDAYNAWIDEGNRQMAWGVSTVNSWYKSDSGRVAQNWPFTLLEYWQQTRTVNPADYDLL